VRSRSEVQRVLQLVREGFNDCEIARTTGIPRSTVREWRHGVNFRLPRLPSAQGSTRVGIVECVDGHVSSRLPSGPYSYLLGVYLGDGCISAGRRAVWKLRVTMDSSYPGIIRECRAAMEEWSPASTPTVTSALVSAASRFRCAGSTGRA
jgi:hypothetical protein